MTTVLRRSLVWGGIFAVVLLVVAGLLGWFVGGGVPGLLGAVIAVTAAALFLGITTASILVAAPISRRRGDPVVFFAIVGGAWLLKLVLFLVLMLSLRAAEWLQPAVFGVTLVVAVVGLLAIDVVAMVRTRVPLLDEPGKNFDES
jgi:hypothetical protein